MNDDSSKKSEDNISTNETAEKDDAIEDETGRRIQDDITSRDPTGKMNLDRRYTNSERRSNKDSDFDGPPRRYTIDRRKITKDRRKPD